MADRKGKIQKRRWFVVEGETGVGWSDHLCYPVFTAIGGPHKQLKMAKAYMNHWMSLRFNLYSARIMRIDETRTVLYERQSAVRSKKTKIT